MSKIDLLPPDLILMESLYVILALKSRRKRVGTSRMCREAHIRICGGLEARLLRSTRQKMRASELLSSSLTSLD